MNFKHTTPPVWANTTTHTFKVNFNSSVVSETCQG